MKTAHLWARFERHTYRKGGDGALGAGLRYRATAQAKARDTYCILIFPLSAGLFHGLGGWAAFITIHQTLGLSEYQACVEMYAPGGILGTILRKYLRMSGIFQ